MATNNGSCSVQPARPAELNHLILRSSIGQPGVIKVTYDDQTYEVETRVVPWRLDDGSVSWNNYAGFDQVGKIAFVSDEVPERWRPHVLWHAIMCCYVRKDDSHCFHITADELSRVPLEERYAYAQMRLQSFQSRLKYMSGDSNGELDDLRESINYLQAYCQSHQPVPSTTTCPV